MEIGQETEQSPLLTVVVVVIGAAVVVVVTVVVVTGADVVVDVVVVLWKTKYICISNIYQLGDIFITHILNVQELLVNCDIFSLIVKSY